MHAVVGAGLADDLLGFTEILTKPAPTAICHNFHLIWYNVFFDCYTQKASTAYADAQTLMLASPHRQTYAVLGANNPYFLSQTMQKRSNSSFHLFTPSPL